MCAQRSDGCVSPDTTKEGQHHIPHHFYRVMLLVGTSNGLWGKKPDTVVRIYDVIHLRYMHVWEWVTSAEGFVTQELLHVFSSVVLRVKLNL